MCIRKSMSLKLFQRYFKIKFFICLIVELIIGLEFILFSMFGFILEETVQLERVPSYPKNIYIF